LAGDHFAREVLLASDELGAVMRVHFYHALQHLLEPVARQTRLDAQARRAFLRAWEQRLECAGNTHELMDDFRSMVAALLGLAENPGQGGRQMRLQEVVEHIEGHLREPLDIGGMARQAGFSVSRFSSLFKQHAGIPYRAFVLEARLKRARYLLKHSRLSIQQVADEAGFSSPSYFIQAFKRVLKQTPQAFRKDPQH
jgi:AraC-like DNA-binding protein